MAEARHAVTIGAHVTGVKLNLDDDGLAVDFSFTIPLRWSIIRPRLARQAERLRNAIINGSYPLGPVALVVLMAGITTFVLAVERDHWIRQGALAHFVWNVGHWFPFVESLPLLPRVGLLTLWAVFVGFFLLTMLQRILLRLLFSYQGFLYASRGKTPLRVKLWGLVVKLLSGRKPMTYGFTSTLPARPVPALQDTCRRWLESVRAIQDDDEYRQSEALVTSFLENEGPRLQRYLRLKWLVSSNYVADWWEKYCYHKGRNSIMINSNYYVLDGSYTVPTSLRNARAAQMLHNMLKYNLIVEREKIEPMLIQGMVPLDMSQHRRMFATTRIPGRDCDHVKHYEYTDIKHIAVLCRGHFYKVDVIRKNGRILSARELEDLFDFITAEVERLGDNRSRPEGLLPALTSDNRTTWAQARETYFATGLNRASLRAVESAIMFLVLDDGTPSGPTELGMELIAGNGANRWFDKSITLVAFNNGHIGMNCEHSWADAPVIAHMLEWCMMTGDLLPGVYQADGHTKPGTSGIKTPYLPARILFDVPASLGAIITESTARAAEQIADLDLQVRYFEDYGKGFVKRLGVSPDAFVQMALQITYYRNIGNTPLTYESAMARLFKDGRTETIRTVNTKSAAFVKAFLDGSVDPKEKLALLQDACTRHSNTTRDAMSGRGIDRHLFGLYIVSKGKSIESPFLNKALSDPWRLSTSQQPQQQTKRWDLKDPATVRQFGAGGGFGPVCDDGYGVSYMIAGEDRIYFHVSSKKSCELTSSAKFLDTLLETLREMHTTFAPHAKPARVKVTDKKRA